MAFTMSSAAQTTLEHKTPESNKSALEMRMGRQVAVDMFRHAMVLLA